MFDAINEDLHELSKMPKGTHVGQLSFSLLADKLPKQFVPEYDYDFLYKLKCALKNLRKDAHYGSQIIAHNVLEELTLYLITKFADFLMDEYKPDMVKCKVSGIDEWEQWIFDVFDDMDIITCLYSWDYLMPDHYYHFIHWYERQFYN